MVVVSLLALHYSDLSLIPAEARSYFLQTVCFEKNEIEQLEAGVGLNPVCHVGKQFTAVKKDS